VHRTGDTLGLKEGDTIQVWNRVLEWDGDCVTAAMADRWSRESDPLCDAALDALFPKGTSSIGTNLFNTLEEHARVAPVDDPARVFFEALLQNPPPELCASPQDVTIASDFFLENSAQIGQGLSFFGLAGGFARHVSRIVQTLNAVSYLVSGSKSTSVGPPDQSTKVQDDRTHIRLVETLQFVLDTMGFTSSTELWAKPTVNSKRVGAHIFPGGAGWRSAATVRMLHGITRRRARERLNRESDQPLDFVPVNQFDMSGTLAAFSTVPIWSLAILGVPATEREAYAYLAVWRQIGFYLGVSPAILRAHFTSPYRADKFLASAIIHLFTPVAGDMTLAAPTLPILRALANRSPTYTSFEYNCAIARYLIGPELADYLHIPPTSTTMALRLRTVIALQALPVYFGRIYPRQGWHAARHFYIHEALVAVTQANLGMRRTMFRPR
ncbi:hypothetical protein K488DRAFT_9880, partial [Vararia minispora EC-137]